MDKIFLIIHEYDVDGGFGDAISQEDVLGFFRTKEEADKYVEKYSKPQIYDKPYAPLYEHTLYVREMEPLDINEDPWKEETV